MVLIEYIGNQSIAADYPHGNAIHDKRSYIRTQPQVIEKIRASELSSTNRVYQSLVASVTASPTALPRNSQQVKNTIKNAKQAGRLSRDALYNVHELAFDTGFIHNIQTYPDLSIICYHPDMIQLFKSTLNSNNATEQSQHLSYDTTFCLGDFYLSALLFRMTDFNPSPVFALAYLIHERKLASTHELFFRHMSDVCPELRTASNTIILTDSESAITNAISKNLPSLKPFLCWNHILQVI